MALKRGQLFYRLEEVDEGKYLYHIMLRKSPDFTTALENDLLGWGMTICAQTRHQQMVG